MDLSEEETIHSERQIKIICIGAGASGILCAYKLKQHCTKFSLVVYEKNDNVSGTWFENRYPGCACDVPAHNYTYSFEPKHDWSSVYAGSQEIHHYFQDFCTKYDLHRHIRLSHTIERVAWCDDIGQWEVVVLDEQNEHQFKDRCHILIHACGYLNNPAWPEAPGMGDFKGSLIHSARWDESVQLTGKTVALLGSGSSALQILPAIQPDAKSVINFVRSPIWILRTISGKAGAYSAQDKSDFINNPDRHLVLRKYNETVMNSIYSLYLSDSKLQYDTKKHVSKIMEAALEDTLLQDALLPSWAVGCRRLAPDTGYIEAVKEKNVRVVKAGVASFYADGCIDENGEKHKIDIVICATGFNTSYIPRFPIIGLNDLELKDAWEHAPSSYLGVGIARFPNFLMMLGPYTPVANGPTMAAIEAQADYIVRMIDRYQTEPIHSFRPSLSAQTDFMQHVKVYMKSTVYSDRCRSGHKNHTISGRTPTLWPGSTLHYLQTMQETRGEDWVFRYTRNRFAFLGNGISHAEFDAKSDLAYYIREHDDGLPLTRRGRMSSAMRSGSQPSRPLHTTHRPGIFNLPPCTRSGRYVAERDVLVDV